MSDNNKLVPYRGRKPGRGVKKVKPLETGDLCGLLEVAIDGAISRMGRPAEYPPTAAGLDRFTQVTIDFFESVKMANADPNTDGIIPDIEAWAVYLGISRVTLWKYEKRGGEWAEVIGNFKTVIAAAKKQLAMNGKIPTVLAIFDLTNLHDYFSTNMFTPPTDSINTEQKSIADEVKAAGLVWDDEQKRFLPMQGE